MPACTRCSLRTFDIMQFLQQAWYRSSRWLLLLLPLSWLFGVLSRRRRQQYAGGNRPVYHAPVPVIVVGNISVGGTGKTPLVQLLCQRLKQEGFKPGIVSRGYGGKPTELPLRVTVRMSASVCGDEALLLVENSGCPIVVDPDRSAACAYLLKECPDCNVIISDDGLQHYALNRDIEIAVIDGERGLGNGYLLPAGPLREPAGRLDTVDFVVVNGNSGNTSVPNGYSMRLQPDALVHVRSGETQPLTDIDQGWRVHAVAGIGNPGRFFTSLSTLGFAIIPHAFRDHHAFRPEDLQFDDDLDIVMTGKDAVKCREFAPPNCWYLRVQAQLQEAFFIALLAKLDRAMHSNQHKAL